MSATSSISRTDTPLIIMAVVFTFLLSCTLISPMLLEPGSAIGLDGVVGRVDNGLTYETFDPFTRVVYTVGDVFCHQMESRSLFLNGNQLPVCARDTGLIAGAAMGMVMAVLAGSRPKVMVIVILLAPMLMDGTLQLLTSYESNNVLRLATGMLAGIGMAMFMANVSDVMAEGCGTGR